MPWRPGTPVPLHLQMSEQVLALLEAQAQPQLVLVYGRSLCMCAPQPLGGYKGQRPHTHATRKGFWHWWLVLG